MGADDVELTEADGIGDWGAWAPEQLTLRLMTLTLSVITVGSVLQRTRKCSHVDLLQQASVV